MRVFAREGLPCIAGRRHRRRGRRRARVALPLLPLEGRGARDDLPRDVVGARRETRSGSKLGRAAARAAAPVRAHLPRLVAADARARARARARGRAQSGGRAPGRRDPRALPRAAADHRGRPASAGRCAATSTRRSPRGRVYGALEEILTGWVLGQLPGEEDDVERAVATVVDVAHAGLAPERDLQPRSRSSSREMARPLTATSSRRRARRRVGAKLTGSASTSCRLGETALAVPLRAAARGVGDRRLGRGDACGRPQASGRCVPATSSASRRARGRAPVAERLATRPLASRCRRLVRSRRSRASTRTGQQVAVVWAGFHPDAWRWATDRGYWDGEP